MDIAAERCMCSHLAGGARVRRHVSLHPAARFARDVTPPPTMT
jgi:hypothetical protein